ncbi:FKBP-type peptidyl-prolyl cis-trans isomerase [Pedobacter boryungensis]|uniref:Peptidyl-prolyl cis-trans isomerase n=1 Tax=Pedobacter boryungensis TaxID=869962 RepID=A0ABX2DDZ9_9SPHI|nr:FKBP-type peptidyl-prolyl cis-trans isomerase [Pedobacter boryungensis]NQX32047.1 FKBP-type peptidyl-prolyl cis-trans isomerase [Pedobacter boryungensis]
MLKTKILLSLFLIVGTLSSCKKDNYNAEKQAKIDDGLIVDFLAKNSIVAVKHSSGLYYQVLNAGSGNEVTASNTVTVNYQGKLLNGVEFDKSTAPVSFSLAGNLIQGWKIGVPLIKKGGKIRLIIPSALAYKNSSPGAGIPENAVLDFTIDLIDVQ